MAQPIRIALVGIGKIARDQHIPTLQRSPDFELVALIGDEAGDLGFPSFETLDAALASGLAIDAIALCTPPQIRLAPMARAVEAGCGVLVEKPPARTLGEAQRLAALAGRRDLPLLFAWHSRFSPMVAAAREWVRVRQIAEGHVVWRENVAKWHPGQTWLWDPGGFGVFDPGINALSILTWLIDGVGLVRSAELDVPANAQTPVAATLAFSLGNVPIEAVFDFRETEAETWSICLRSVDGETLALSEGGAALRIDDSPIQRETPDEYAGVYGHFASLVRSRRSDTDLRPLQIVADAFFTGVRRPTAMI